MYIYIYIYIYSHWDQHGGPQKLREDRNWKVDLALLGLGGNQIGGKILYFLLDSL